MYADMFGKLKCILNSRYECRINDISNIFGYVYSCAYNTYDYDAVLAGWKQTIHRGRGNPNLYDHSV